MKHLKADFKDKTVIAEELDRLHDKTVAFNEIDPKHIYLEASTPDTPIKEVHLFSAENIEKCYRIYKKTSNSKALKLSYYETGDFKEDFSGFKLEIVDFYYSVYDIFIYGATKNEKGYYDSDFVIVIPDIETVDIVYR